MCGLENPGEENGTWWLLFKYPFYKHIKHLLFCVSDAILSAGDSVMEGAGEGNLLLWSFHSQNLSTWLHNSHKLTTTWVETAGSHKRLNLTLSFLEGGKIGFCCRMEQLIGRASAFLCTARPGEASSPGMINNRHSVLRTTGGKIWISQGPPRKECGERVKSPRRQTASLRLGGGGRAANCFLMLSY